jgi:hypothetical protein
MSGHWRGAFLPPLHLLFIVKEVLHAVISVVALSGELRARLTVQLRTKEQWVVFVG